MAACRVYCVSRVLFRMSLTMDVRCATYRVRLLLDSNYLYDYTMHSVVYLINTPTNAHTIIQCSKILTLYVAQRTYIARTMYAP